MISMDLVDGFHALGIAPEHQKFMSFRVGTRVFSYQVAPFGWCESPRRFVMLMDTLVRALRAPSADGLLRALRSQSASKTQVCAALLAPQWDRSGGKPRAAQLDVQRLRILPYMDDFLACFRAARRPCVEQCRCAARAIGWASRCLPRSASGSRRRLSTTSACAYEHAAGCSWCHR